MTYTSYFASKDIPIGSLLDENDEPDLPASDSLLTRMPLRSSNHSGLHCIPFRRKSRAPLIARVNLIDMKNPFASVEWPSDMTDLQIFAVSCYESALNAVLGRSAQIFLQDYTSVEESDIVSMVAKSYRMLNTSGGITSNTASRPVDYGSFCNSRPRTKWHHIESTPSMKKTMLSIK